MTAQAAVRFSGLRKTVHVGFRRKPVEILKCQYSYLSFYSNGMLKKGGEGEVKLAMDMLEPVIIERAKQVVDARHKFARKLYAREYRWEPSPEIEASIHKAIFG